MLSQDLALIEALAFKKCEFTLYRLTSILIWGLVHALPGHSSTLASSQANFLGSIATTCSFSSLGETSEMSWRGRWNDFFGRADFNVLSNTNSIKLSLSSIATNSEPADITSGTHVFARLYSPENTIISSSDKSTIGTANSFTVDPGQVKALNIRIWVRTNSMDGELFYLKPGHYEYELTVSCLQ